MFLFTVPEDAPSGLRERFENECAPYAPMVYRHCLQVLRHPHDAEDAAQETMLRAFRAFGGYHGNGVASWLYRIAHHVCLDRLKSAQRKHETLSVDDEHSAEPADSAQTPEEQLLSKARDERLWAQIARLPREMQLTLRLYYGENLSYTQIAKACGVSEGTVKSRLNRARTVLRKALEDDAEW